MSTKSNDKSTKIAIPKLPQMIKGKIYKTGQTRGADDDVIYQNRVLRNNTVLIPFSMWKNGLTFPNKGDFENGFIVLISPEEYFTIIKMGNELNDYDLIIGENALVFYVTREQWQNYNPDKLGWIPAQKRNSPLEGQYVARVAATTSINNGEKINRGFNGTSSKGAGIRVYEYASKETINLCSLQLEALFWHCSDSFEITIKYGMTEEDALKRRKFIIDSAEEAGLLDYELLFNSRMIDKDQDTICPLCLEKLSSEGFFTRMKQAEGREVHDLTVTELNLFHIDELKINEYNHHPYNLGWGHHHCNVVVKDMGISETINWMKRIIETNKQWESS
ncbi:BstXI family restriction endonuclease [Methanococcoides methylutens]|uniref:BstXI family restriction endonuclease n=1 Tax=Methanococcoides methylutens TaxID=2226 RepID=UPI00064FB0E6|nr:BstXI family restriction endonuclease [Methanococcoides methylutens]